MASWWQRLCGRGGGPGIRLVAGLGNPEPRYADTPHNVGFAVVDRMARELGVELRPSRRARSNLAKTVWQGRKLWLAQPLTYMNKSGLAVGSLMRTAGIPPADLIVVLDDIDLPLGSLRVRPAGGDAGHRGLRSVRECLGSGEFARVRLGVGREPRPEDVVKYVLKPFAPDERPAVEEMVQRAVAAVMRILADGVDAAMNEYNGRRQ